LHGWLIGVKGRNKYHQRNIKVIHRGFCHLTNTGNANAFLQATVAAIAEKHSTKIVKKQNYGKST